MDPRILLTFAVLLKTEKELAPALRTVLAIVLEI